MAVRSRGQVVERCGKSGYTYAIRFSANGRRRYLTLGRESEGWTRRLAEDELANVLADARRGLWVEPSPGARRRPRRRKPEILFAVFADNLLAERRPQLSEATGSYLEWGLMHLCSFFSDWLLRDIDAEVIDAYRAKKVRDAEELGKALERGRPRRDKAGRARRPLSPSSINKTIDVLQWLLSAAEEYGWIDSNPARGRRRRLPKPKCLPVYLNSAEQIEALLEAAGELDADPRSRIDHRLPLIATLVFAGLRSQELSALRWRDIDLTAGRIQVRVSKTQAGLREIRPQPILRSLMEAHWERADAFAPEALVFPTRTGRQRSKDNLRGRILAPVIARANERLEARGNVPLPEGLSPHKLRHTFASLLVACGEDPASVMYQLGHTNPAFTLSAYAHVMRRGQDERKRLRMLVSGVARATRAQRHNVLPGCG
jgi:integrase